jgi:hypothetical protein
MPGKIKVSEATVAKLRKGTMAGNLAKAKNASPELREALVRFYGAKRVNAAAGPKKTPNQATSAMPETKKKTVVPPQAKRAGLSEASKAKKYPGRPGPSSSAAPKTNNTAKSKPLIDLPKKAGGAKAAMQTKAKTNADLYAKQQKMAQDKKKKLK